MNSETYLLLDLIVDPQERSVRRGNERLHATDLTFDLLLFMLRKWPDTITLEAAASEVWRQNHVSETTLTKRVALLRRALGESATAPRYIRKVRGVGYALIPDVQRRDMPRAKLNLGAPKTAIAGISIAAMFGFGFLIIQNANEPELAEQGAVADLSDIQLTRAKDLLRLHQPAETDLAIALLEQILARDGTAPEAELALSFAYSTRATKFRATEDDTQKAEDLARRVISSDLKSGGAWHALGYALDAQGRVDEALAAYKQAYTIDDEDVAAMSSAAYLFQIRGRLYDALELEAMALKAGRTSIYAPIQIATTLSLLNHQAAEDWWFKAEIAGPNQLVVLTARMEQALRHDRADQCLRLLSQAPEALQSMPKALRLEGRAMLKLGRQDEARAAFEAAGQEAWLEMAALDLLEQNAGPPIELMKQIDRMMLDGDTWPEFRIRVAELHAMAGHTEQASLLVSRAIDLGWRDWTYIETSPFFETLMSSPEAAILKARIDHEVTAQKRLVLASPSDAVQTILATAD
ncbi:MAG: winged helix-turn-helix domain-containing protein [Henriciella sp.]|nr:winged helix-turn-helix domain-containing protein [Henriciella sp.]